MGKAKYRQRMKKKPDGLFRKIFSKPLRERFCQWCGRPYLGHIEPVPEHRFILGNAEVQVFESKPFGKRKFELKVHCWNRYHDEWHPQSVFTLDDFQCLAFVVRQALRFIEQQHDSPKETPVVKSIRTN